jgi:cation:H+ antiporter
MHELILPVLAIIGGLTLLVWSADRFVDGASSTALRFGIPPLLIGIFILGFGTSAPEMIVSGVAAYEGNPGLALGNVIGSNIANIGLVLGVAALITPLIVRSETIRREVPILLGITFITFALMADFKLSLFDGVLLGGLLVLVMGFITYSALKSRRTDPLEEETLQEVHHYSTAKSLVLLCVGLVLLVVSARVLVWGAVEIAQSFGISDVIIGLTIVAIGTSLPELAAAITSALKGEDDLTIGNVLGSNLFNLMAVLSIAALIAPMNIDKNVVWYDYGVMAGMTLLLALMIFNRGEMGRITRLKAGSLVTLFTGYMGWLIYITV